MTNSATSNYWDNSRDDGSFTATQCYAAIQGGKWVKGCGFGKAPKFHQQFALKIINRDRKQEEQEATK